MPARPALALLLAAAVAVTACGDSRPKRRVVLVTVDTLRWDAFFGGALGSDGRELPGGEGDMPRTREVAAAGQVFTRFFASCSTTQPTHASLFTGLHPWQHGVSRNGQVLSGEHRTIAEHLAEHGFETVAAIGSFPLRSEFGFDQGFDTFDEALRRSLVGHSLEWEGVPVQDAGFYRLGKRLSDRAIELVDGARSDRQFFWFHFFDPHDPYGDTSYEMVDLPDLLEAVSEDEGRAPDAIARAHELYRRDVAALDAELARLFARLLAGPDADEFETHVVFTVDHGESFGEDGSLGHGKRLSRSQIQVPTFLVSPRVAPGTRADVAGSIDVPVTLASLAGVPWDGLAGRDLSAPPAGESGALGMRRTFAGGRFVDLSLGRGLVEIEGERFYAVRPDGTLLTGDGAAVTLDDGPRAADAARAAEMRPAFRRFALELAGRAPEELDDPGTRRALEALGYTD